jgi:hypothetical protein
MCKSGGNGNENVMITGIEIFWYQYSAVWVCVVTSYCICLLRNVELCLLYKIFSFMHVRLLILNEKKS